MFSAQDNPGVTYARIQDSPVGGTVQEIDTFTLNFSQEPLEVGQSKTITYTYVVQPEDAGKTIRNTAYWNDETNTDIPADSTETEIEDQYKVVVNLYADDVLYHTEESAKSESDSYKVEYDASITKDGVTYAYDYHTGVLEGGFENAVDGVVTVNVYYAKDVIGPGDKPDEVPDKYQIIVEYRTQGGGKIADGALTKEVLTIRDDEGNPAETGDVTVTGSTAEEADIHYTFQLWNVRELGHANTYNLDLLPAFTNHELIQVKGGKTYIYTALFESRQVEIRKVSDHTTANVGDVIRYEIHVHNTGTADLTDVVVEDIMTYEGTSAFSGSITVAEQTGVVYDADSGSFTIASISAGQFVNIIYTYTVRVEDAGKTLVNTVVVEDENIDTPDEPVVEIPVYPYYIVEHYKADENGVYPDSPTETERFNSTDGENVQAVAKDYAGYCLNTQISKTKGTVQKNPPLVLMLYYDMDQNDDVVPDKYQKRVIFKVVNGEWNEGGKDDIVTYVTLTNAEGKWDANGSGSLTAPSVGDKPAEGFKAGSWDKEIPATVSGTDPDVYTYTYLRATTPIVPGDTVSYIVEHYKANEDGTYPDAPTDSGVYGGKIGASVTATPMDYEGYTLNTQISNTTGTLVKIGNQEDILILKLYYDIDKVGEEDPTEPDDIPDKYQKKVTFKVVNGAWNDETEADIVTYVTLTNAEGKWDANGSGTLTAPAVGDEPDEGYNPGSWDVTPPATVSGMEDAVYTYTYKLVPATPIEPADTVNYIVEHYKANEDGTYPAEPTDRGVHGGKIGAAVTAAPMNYEGYCLNEQISTMTGTLVKITKQEDIVVLKLYYDIDKIGDEEDPAKPDDIPDKYQKKVTFKVVNGAWNDKTDADQVVYVTLEKDGKWDKDGFGSLTAPAVGNEPDAGYQAGSWDVTPPSTVSGLEDAVYTYTYLPKPPATGSVTLTKVDSEDNDTTLANVIFDLYRADGTKVDTFTTGKDGTITVNDLSEGEHYWVEVRPAEGYTMDYTKHSFTVTGNATVELEIENTRTPVPEVFSGDHYAYIIGYNDGMVHPEDNITRAEVATIFFRMLDDATREKYMTKNNSFSDVFAGDWYNAAISTMAAMDIINGFPDGTFRPNEKTTRAEFAAIAARFDKNGNTTGASFSDIYGHWAQKEINVAYNNGWVLGYTDGTFVPDQPISRAEAMTMINRVLQRVPESVDDLLEDMVKWPDNMDPAKWYYLAVQEATNTHDYERKRNGYEHWTKIGEVRDWTELEK